MASYLNPSSKGFVESLQSEIYVDKSKLIERTNAKVNTKQKFICVSRPRRFGKSMAAEMLSAYYGCGEDTSALFENLKISEIDSYKKHLNKYDVIKFNVQSFLSKKLPIDEMLRTIKNYILFDLFEKYGNLRFRDKKDLIEVLNDIFNKTKRPFIFLIDEWDCMFREYTHNTEAQKLYLDFLRALLKDQEYVALAYMTGILPIKKYGTHSALKNNRRILVTLVVS